MPLLSIPYELLLEIIGHVAASAPPTASLASLARTCTVLRSLSITLIYSSITLHREARQLGSFMIDYPHIATCIRHLKIEAPSLWPDDNRHFLRRLLERCTEVQELVLKRSPGTRTGFEDGLLGYLPMSSKQTIKTLVFHGLPLGGLLAHFKRMLDGDFSALQTMRIQSYDVYNTHDVHRDREEQTQLMRNLLVHANAESPGALKSIRSFLFNAPFPYRLAEETSVGACFANAMPSLMSLSMNTSSDVIYGALSTYTSFGSNLTELTLTASYPLGPRASLQRGAPQHNHFCDIILKLSRNLTKFVICGNSEMRICHTLFTPNTGISSDRAENWPNLQLLNVRCFLGCEGIKSDMLHSGLRRLTKVRPGAVLFMEGRFHENLVSWNTCSPEGVPFLNAYGVALEKDFIASLDAFERLNPSPVPMPSSNDDGGNEYDANPEDWSLEEISFQYYEEDKAPWIDE